jgi:hypothetical protein
VSRGRRLGRDVAVSVAALGAVGAGAFGAADGISSATSSEKPSLVTPSPVVEKATDKHCGEERWSVKTLTDDGAGNVDFVPRDATINELGLVPAPKSVQDDMPRQSQELNVYRVVASIFAFKQEEDSDIHLAIMDPNPPQATMIAEFPAATCDTSALEKQQIDQARDDFVAAFGRPSTKWKKPPGCATITGVFFFDKKHGQVGRAPNAAELHPVLSFKKEDPSLCAGESATTTGTTTNGAATTATTTTTKTATTQTTTGP